MATIHDAIESAIDEVVRARKRISKITTKQVRGIDHVASLKATAQTWFHSHRPTISAGAPFLDLESTDLSYTSILRATAKHSTKKTYLDALQSVKLVLLNLRELALTQPESNRIQNTDDLAPDFSPLAGNQEMRDILIRRWHECAKCVKAEAHLAAIVMMGGLLEALFVARANKLSDKSPLISATNAPKDKTTNKVINYQEWMLDAYIKVGRELNWITESAKDVADTLKEFRNFIHPAKELRYGITLGLNDSSMFWQVTKALARQLLLSAK